MIQSGEQRLRLFLDVYRKVRGRQDRLHPCSPVIQVCNGSAFERTPAFGGILEMGEPPPMCASPFSAALILTTA